MPIPKIRLELSRSPLTDFRALLSSGFVHAAVLLTASLMVLGISKPGDRDDSHVMKGEFATVDNHAPEDAGGGAGEVGGRLLPEDVRVSAESNRSESQTGRASSTDALLSEALPSAATADVSVNALSGPSTSGAGILPGLGEGGGGGEGGGSGGGKGRGIGPGTEFFGTREQANSFVYVIDRSGSMLNHHSLEVAKRELLASLNQLPPDVSFGLIFYNMNAYLFPDTKGRAGLMPANSEAKARVRTKLRTIEPDGGTDHMTALHAALALKPEVIFFLTDADLMRPQHVREIVRDAGATRITALEFGDGPDIGNTELRRLAEATGGTYRYIDVTKFTRPPG